MVDVIYMYDYIQSFMICNYIQSFMMGVYKIFFKFEVVFRVFKSFLLLDKDVTMTLTNILSMYILECGDSKVLFSKLQLAT